MKKLLLKSMLLLCALVVGSMNGWAGNTGSLVSALSDLTEGTYYITALSNSKYYTVPNTTIDAQTFTCTQGKTIGDILIPAANAGEFVFTSAGVANAFYIYNTNLEKYLVATASKKFGYVESSSSDYGYWTFSTVASGGFSGIFSVQHSSKSQYMRAYDNTVKCYDGASNQGIYLFKKNPNTGKETEVTINSTGITNTDVYTSTIAGKLTASIKDEDEADVDGIVLWSSNKPNVAKVGSDGSITLVSAGTTTITAEYIGQSGTYKSSSKTYNLTVIDSNPAPNDGSAAKPYTVAQAIAAIDAAGTKISDVYVTGIVTRLSGGISSGQLTYFISDDGLTTVEFEAFKGKGISGAAFTNDTKVAVNDKVVVHGNMLLYNSSVYEFEANNDLISKTALTIAKEVGEDGWATYVSAGNYEFEKETAFTVTATGINATLTPVTQVPTGTPLILKGAGKKYVTELGSAPSDPTNLLAISDGTTDLNGCYVLGVKNGIAGFYKWGGTTITSGKVYLPASSTSREFLGFSFGDNNETTGVNELKAQKAANQYYNLAGQRVAQPTKGLYIVNGKKVIMK